jgi:transcription factor MYB, plant
VPIANCPFFVHPRRHYRLASLQEDELLKKCVVGQLDWEQIDWSQASKMVNGRNHKQCRDRWHNYLRPGLVKGHWTMEEEEVIKEMHRTFGPKYVYSR